jgi:hypothetical protein
LIGRGAHSAPKSPGKDRQIIDWQMIEQQSINSDQNRKKSLRLVISRLIDL